MRDYKVGDFVHFVLGTTAGVGTFIGRLKQTPDVLVIVLGAQPVEIDAADCTPMAGGRPAEAESWRRSYLKQHPGSLA